MSSGSSTSFADEWVQVARKDWRRAERNLTDRDTEAAGFFLQCQREPDFGVTSVNYNFAELLLRAEPPR